MRWGWLGVLGAAGLVGCYGATAPVDLTNVAVATTATSPECLVMQQRNGQALMANAPDMNRYPAAVALGRRLEVTLPSVAGRYEGTLSLSVTEEATYQVLMSRDVPVSLTPLASGAILNERAVAPVSGCGEIAARRLYRLKPGDYFIQLGPAVSDSVGLAVVVDTPSKAD